MGIINRLEQKYGRWGIPGLIRIVCAFTVLNYFLAMINPEMVEMLHLNVAKVLRGEVWRLFTFVVVPPALTPLWLLFYIGFLYWAGENVERVMGAFRWTLFYLGAVLGAIVFMFILYFLRGPAMGEAGAEIYTIVCARLLAMLPVIVFAIEFPNLEIRLMLVLPVKMKWIGLIDAGLALMLAFQDPFRSYYSALALLLVFFTFFVVYVPVYVRFVKHRASVVDRRRVFRAGSRPEDEALHHCAACGATEFDDPDIDFRVSGGEEYCVPCLEKKKVGGS